MIPEIHNDLHGKGRGASLPTFLQISNQKALEGLVSSPGKTDGNHSVLRKKRSKKRLRKQNFNKEVQSVLEAKSKPFIKNLKPKKTPEETQQESRKSSGIVCQRGGYKLYRPIPVRLSPQ